MKRNRPLGRSYALFGCLPMILISAVTIAAIALRQSPPPVYTQEPISATGGQVVGTVNGGIRSYKGIPFAAPPIGANRWRAPQPVIPWSGVRKADAYPPPCRTGAPRS